MKCEKCGQFVNWNDPNIHYGGHTCDPIDVAEHNLKKMKEEKQSGGVYDFNGMKDEEIGRLKNTVYEQNRTINELRERLNNKPEKRNALPDGTLPLTEEELKEFDKVSGYNFEKYRVHNLTEESRIIQGCDGHLWWQLYDIKAILWLAERFNLEEICK